MTTIEMLETARNARPLLAALNSEQKNAALAAMADAIDANAAVILAENAADLEAAKGRISDVMLDRLRLTEARIKGMSDGIRDVIALPDPVGKVLNQRSITDGLELTKISVPLGVVAIVYESRPNVTSDAAALCLKSGNVCVLRSGKEAYRSAHAIATVMQDGLEAAGFARAFINIVEDVSHEGVNELLRAKGYVDLLIPRGGKKLISLCVEQAIVPCIETGTGICSIYVDESADEAMALNIIENAKTQRPSVCNAEETLLVNEAIAGTFLPKLKQRLVDDRIAAGLPPVELRLCSRALDLIPGTAVTDADFDTEFLDYILAVKVVKDVNEAVAHIARHSTHHSEAIITQDSAAADYFTRNVDSTSVYVNASTRFTDGGCFGLGCEMGISTQKLHARGPMGLEELTCYKYVVRGNGQIRT